MMSTNKHGFRAYFTLALLLASTPVAIAQQLPGAHPYYLHALTDLRTARGYLQRQPGDAKVYAGEAKGVSEIEGAVNELKRASIDDHKDINDHPKIDVKDHGSRLQKAIELLKTAQSDAGREEDNPQARGLKTRVLDHITKASQAATEAHADWLKEPKK
jgi:hypothetical protein